MIDYLYYRLYKLCTWTERSTPKSARNPQWVAVFTLSILISLNLGSIFIIYSANADSFGSISFNRFHGILTAIILYAGGYFLFIHDKKYLEIEKKYDALQNKNASIKNILFWLYVIITIIIFFILIPIFIEPRIER